MGAVGACEERSGGQVEAQPEGLRLQGLGLWLHGFSLRTFSIGSAYVPTGTSSFVIGTSTSIRIPCSGADWKEMRP
jgi:hypothetical protein